MNTLNSLTLWFMGIKGEPIKLTRDQRRIFNKQARAGFLRSPLHFVGFLGLQLVPLGYTFLVVILCTWLFIVRPSREPPSAPNPRAGLYTTLAMLPMFPMIPVTIALGFRLFYRRHIREALRKVGYELCPRCGYNLGHGDLSRACPECGWRPEPAL